MAFIVDETTGNITCVQGDSGTITLNGLPSNSNYSVYFSVYDENRKILSETVSQSSSASIMTMSIPATVTDVLKVPVDEDFAVYYYGIKICNELTGYEDTLCINGGNIGDLNEIYVYPKKVEGLR